MKRTSLILITSIFIGLFMWVSYHFFKKDILVKTIPVIFIHKTNSDYLKHSLWQAKQYNKQVILIGDDTNKNYPEIEHHDMQDYFDEAAYFSTIYHHLAENPYGYELFCYQRWFVLKEFMEKNDIDRCFYCDSDIMLYCNVSQEYKKFNFDECILAIPPHGIVSGHLSYWNKKALQEWCSYLRSYYENQSNIDKLIEWFKSPTKPRGWGVCDMRILTEWKHTRQIRNILTVINDAAFDHHMFSDEGECYRMKYRRMDPWVFKVKDIMWKDNQPYGYHLKRRKWIRFKSLHFQGGAKKFMNEYRRVAQA